MIPANRPHGVVGSSCRVDHGRAKEGRRTALGRGYGVEHCRVPSEELIKLFSANPIGRDRHHGGDDGGPGLAGGPVLMLFGTGDGKWGRACGGWRCCVYRLGGSVGTIQQGPRGSKFRMATSKAQLTMEEIKYGQGGVVGSRSRGRDAVARQDQRV